MQTGKTPIRHALCINVKHIYMKKNNINPLLPSVHKPEFWKIVNAEIKRAWSTGI